MNASPSIVFAPDGTAFLDTGSRVTGFRATAQNALVNLLCEQGADAVFEDRGTGLLSAALNGALFDARTATHRVNFAGLDTLYFSREHENAPAEDKLASLSLTIKTLNLLSLDVEATFVAISGDVLSFPITTAT